MNNNEQFKLMFKLKKRNMLIKLAEKHINLSSTENAYLLQNDENYQPAVLTQQLFNKHFPNNKYSVEIYPDMQSKAERLFQGNSPYIRAQDNMYCGSFDIEFADKLMNIFHDKSIINSIQKGVFFNAVPSFDIDAYSISILSRQDYLDGIPLYIGESTNTCESVGKLGSDLAINYLFNPKSQIVLIQKNLTDGSKIHLGHFLVWTNNERNKIVLSAFESIYIPEQICCKILTKIAYVLYDIFNAHLHFQKQELRIQIGIGGRTLRSIGHPKENFPQNLLPRHLEIVRGISKPSDYEELMQCIKQNNNPLLNDLQLKLDDIQIESDISGCEVHEDSRYYRLTLVDKNCRDILT